MLIHFLDVVVKVAIIGAGISGIGSSVTFSKNNVEHTIIEARNRTGGRITSIEFDGVTVQLGANYVRSIASEDNQIAQQVRSLNWTYTQMDLSSSQTLYQGQGVLNQSITWEAYFIFEDLCTDIVDEQNITKKALDLKQASNNYFKKITNHTAQAVDVAEWSLNFLGIYNGAELKDLGASQCLAAVDLEDAKLDRGYADLIQEIYSTKCHPKQLKLNEVVKKIDYSGDIVKIYTDSNTYHANKVVSSLPLGVLLDNKVEFVPKLPKNRITAMKAMGKGVFNRIHVSFEQPFWDITHQWVNFVLKDGVNKYPTAEATVKQGRYILCFFTYGDISTKMSSMTDQELKQDILAFLKLFYPDKVITIRALAATKWQDDPFALISYSFKEVGTNPQQLIAEYCAPLDNKIWFVGEHCHPQGYSFSHAAYETGIWAAQNITAFFN